MTPKQELRILTLNEKLAWIKEVEDGTKEKDVANGLP